MSTFTPGPWRVDGRYVRALKAKVVAELPEGGVMHGKVDTANAYLIASAPLLKAALIQALEEGTNDHPGRCGYTWCWIDQAHAALKASVPPTPAAGASADAGGQAT